jgi:hypothetical protein
MEKRFQIKWEIDQFAENPLEAIRKAIAAFPHENNEDTLATVFDVQEIDENGKVVNTEQIDLLDEEESNNQEDIASVISITDTINWFNSLDDDEKQDVRDTFFLSDDETPVWHDVKLMYTDEIKAYVK